MLAVFVYITALIELVRVAGVHPTLDDACASWHQWKNSLHNDNDIQLQCNINKYCTGIDCSGKYQDFKLDLELLMQHCASPVSVEFHLSIPQLNIRDWRHTFVHGERYPLPGVRRGSFVGNGSLEIYLQQRDEETVIFGCSVMEQSIAGNGKTMSILPIRNQTIKLPPCPKVQQSAAVVQRAHGVPIAFNNVATLQQNAGKNCALDALSGCGDNEICNEVPDSPTPRGICDCLPNFVWNSDGICADDDSVTVSPGPPAQNPTTASSAVQIAVPIALIALTATLVVLAYKFRWVSKLRARLRQPTHVYEEMIIDGEDATSIHSLATNPVA